MDQQEKNTNTGRSLLTKRPFFRINADVGVKNFAPRQNVNEQPVLTERINYDIVTQEDFLRELDPNSHAINDHTIYQNWVEHEDGKFYETQWERYAFAFQREILEDRLVRLTGNDIQFDLSDRTESQDAREMYYKFKSIWAEKSMERAWFELAKSVLSTGDGAFAGILSKGKFYWKVFSFMKGDVLYPHYDRITGRLNVFARMYHDYDDNGSYRTYVDAWDDTYYYRFADFLDGDEDKEVQTSFRIGEFNLDGYYMEVKAAHNFNRIPIAYKRDDFGPCWSASQDTIEKYELAFSRLAQSNAAFGLPILSLSGSGKSMKELAMGDMSYAAKIFLIPKDGEAKFLQRQDASGAYKAQLDELKRKIYEQSHVVKAPELKSGDTPAAAIKLLYSDSYNKGMNETQEFDGCIDDMVEIFSRGAGIEYKCHIAFQNLPITHWIIVFLPISENELTTILATGVQNGFCSKQTASEKFPYCTPQEWARIQGEKHDDKAQELLLQEQRLEIQNDAQVELQEDLSKIQTVQQVAVAKAQADIDSGDTPDSDEPKPKKVRIKQGSGSQGKKRGRPNMSGRQYDEDRNWEGRNNWGDYNSTH